MGFPEESEESQTSTLLLDPGSSRGLISWVYRALKEDRQTGLELLTQRWNDDLDSPLTDGEWR